MNGKNGASFNLSHALARPTGTQKEKCQTPGLVTKATGSPKQNDTRHRPVFQTEDTIYLEKRGARRCDSKRNAG